MPSSDEGGNGVSGTEIGKTGSHAEPTQPEAAKPSQEAQASGPSQSAFDGESATVGKGDGAIETFKSLQDKVRAEYAAAGATPPANVQEFLDTKPEKLAETYKFYKPENEGGFALGKESANMQVKDTISLTAEGKVTFTRGETTTVLTPQKGYADVYDQKGAFIDTDSKPVPVPEARPSLEEQRVEREMADELRTIRTAEPESASRPASTESVSREPVSAETAPRPIEEPERIPGQSKSYWEMSDKEQYEYWVERRATNPQLEVDKFDDYERGWNAYADKWYEERGMERPRAVGAAPVREPDTAPSKSVPPAPEPAPRPRATAEAERTPPPGAAVSPESASRPRASAESVPTSGAETQPLTRAWTNPQGVSVDPRVSETYEYRDATGKTQISLYGGPLSERVSEAQAYAQQHPGQAVYVDTSAPIDGILVPSVEIYIYNPQTGMQVQMLNAYSGTSPETVAREIPNPQAFTRKLS